MCGYISNNLGTSVILSLYDTQLLKDPAHTFHTFKEAPRLIIIIDSFNLIKKRIELSQLSQDMKDLFFEKLTSLYNSKLKNPFTDLSERFKELNQEKDEYTNKIINMVNEA